MGLVFLFGKIVESASSPNGSAVPEQKSEDDVEADCEYLKWCYETLAEENRRLQELLIGRCKVEPRKPQIKPGKGGPQTNEVPELAKQNMKESSASVENAGDDSYKNIALAQARKTEATDRLHFREAPGSSPKTQAPPIWEHPTDEGAVSISFMEARATRLPWSPTRMAASSELARISKKRPRATGQGHGRETRSGQSSEEKGLGVKGEEA
ncbi:hypothetical protein NL676_027117 [Syzygium grande]|nr:hypothetical protein NL676_027117 [Syzygium grande]